MSFVGFGGFVSNKSHNALFEDEIQREFHLLKQTRMLSKIIKNMAYVLRKLHE